MYGIYGACLKWMLPELSFSDRWSRGTKLWERDWNNKGNNRILVIRLHCAVRCLHLSACLKWLLPELSFSDRWSRGTKLWERDCVPVARSSQPAWLHMRNTNQSASLHMRDKILVYYDAPPSNPATSFPLTSGRERSFRQASMRRRNSVTKTSSRCGIEFCKISNFCFCWNLNLKVSIFF